MKSYWALTARKMKSKSYSSAFIKLGIAEGDSLNTILRHLVRSVGVRAFAKRSGLKPETAQQVMESRRYLGIRTVERCLKLYGYTSPDIPIKKQRKVKALPRLLRRKQKETGTAR